jgi:glucokinase
MQTQSPLAPRDSGAFVVGVDVGGTKIAAGVVDSQGQIYGRVQLPTDASQPEMTLSTIESAVTRAMQAAGVSATDIRGVGLGIPGKVDVEHGICLLAVNLGWQNVPVRSRLEEALDLPCSVENDVSAAVLGESLYGVGQGVANLAYLILGTGIAARVMVAGKLHRGAHELAGEIGHTLFVADGPQCRCGARGCLEALAAGPALARRAQEALLSGDTSLLQDVLTRQATLTAEHVFAAAEQGDRLALQVVTEAAEHIAQAIYLLSMTFDPQILVLGGGLVQAEILINAIQTSVARKAEQSPLFREIYSAQFVRLTGLKQDAGILGAAALVAVPAM